MKPIILASASPRRRAILESLGSRFEVRSVAADESLDAQESRHPAEYLAERKGLLARQLEPHSWIIACDTIVEAKDEFQPAYLGKPTDATEARKMLQMLSGRWHLVRTGHGLFGPDGQNRIEVVTTEVLFRPLDERLLDWYLATGEWQDKAGSYAIQEKGSLLVQEFRGDYLNVVGMSAVVLDRMFQAEGLDLIEMLSSPEAH